MIEKIILLLVMILFAEPAYAYIDPNIGAMFFQSLVAALMLVPFYAKRIIGYIKNIFREKNAEGKKKGTIDD